MPGKEPGDLIDIAGGKCGLCRFAGEFPAQSLKQNCRIVGRTFDRPTATTHPRRVRSVLRRVASVVCVLAFAQSAATLCAGWQATPEARMECCRDGACPLHRHEHGAPRAHITQAAADDCCALSASPESSPPATAFASTITLAVLQSVPPVVVSLAPALLLSAPWETASPPTHVPKHVLLSVFLV